MLRDAIGIASGLSRRRKGFDSPTQRQPRLWRGTVSARCSRYQRSPWSVAALPDTTAAI